MSKIWSTDTGVALHVLHREVETFLDGITVLEHVDNILVFHFQAFVRFEFRSFEGTEFRIVALLVVFGNTSKTWNVKHETWNLYMTRYFVCILNIIALNIILLQTDSEM